MIVEQTYFKETLKQFKNHIIVQITHNMVDINAQEQLVLRNTSTRGHPHRFMKFQGNWIIKQYSCTV